MEQNNSLLGRKVRTSDDALRVFQTPDLNAVVRCQVPCGAEIQLGAVLEADGREWIEAALPDGTSGFVLGASMRSHTIPVSNGENRPSISHVVAGMPVHSQVRQTTPNQSAPIKGGVGLGRTVQDFLVTGFGIATSSLTALILAFVESKLGFSFYSFMWWFVIPVGALLSGFAAASGYYFGAKVFNHRPTRLMLFNMISVALTTYFLLNYLNYSFMEVKGHPVSQLIPFSQYMDIVLSRQAMEFRIRGARVGETGELGNLGYVTALLQVLGFAVGGLCVYGHLRSAPFCGACGKYLKKYSSVTRFTNDTEQLKVLYSGLIGELQAGNSGVATQLISGFGATKKNVKEMKLNAELKLWKCVSCPQEFFESSINQWNGKDWKPVSGLLLRDYLPRA
jgi:hypothetical protein